jgi:hypothetical protein
MTGQWSPRYADGLTPPPRVVVPAEPEGDTDPTPTKEEAA